MKTKQLLLISGILLFLFSASDLYADRRVHVKKSRKSAYHNKTPRAKVKFAHKTHHVNSFRVLPKNAISIKHKGMRFHYYGGKYYRHYAGNYVNVIPPIGIRIRLLPSDYMTFVVGRKAYYYVDGIYYMKRHSGRSYEVVEAPIGAIVNHLPLSAERIRINNESFFQCNLTIYSKVRSSYGHAYKVVGHLQSYGRHY